MNPRLITPAAACLGLILCQLATFAQDYEFFETRVRPVLAKNCFACHTGSQMGGLRLDSREAVLKGGKSGPAVVPGHPAESLLMQAVRRTHERLKMPPAGKLQVEEIANLSEWIRTGAVWPAARPPAHATSKTEYGITPEQRAFWAFQPMSKPPLPPVKDEAWARSPIDRFVLNRLEKERIKPVLPAARRELIRRATFDLIGLPPTPEEVDAFVNDASTEAFAKVVERLLSSPHYGERWGRYWLDLARYSDGKFGGTKDIPYPNAFRYRDWVIQAFNEDMPYDVFVKAQIAADLLPPENRERLLPGLGFHALGPAEVAGVPAEDRVDVTGRAFLGLTLGCAACHDHKFDPIPTQDYYSLLGVFKSSENAEIPLVSTEEAKAYQTLKREVDKQQAAIDDFVDKQSAQLVDIMMARTSRYLLAAAKVQRSDSLDGQTLARWVKYLQDSNTEHPFLKDWFAAVNSNAGIAELRAAAAAFESTVLAVHAEKKAIDDRNYIKLGGAEGLKDNKKRQFSNLEFLPADKGYLWRDLASGPFTNVGDNFHFPGGIYYYGKTSTVPEEADSEYNPKSSGEPIDRFLQGDWREHLEFMRARLAELKSALPPKYPFLHGVKDAAKPANIRVYVRGDEINQGEEAPRRFLQILCEGEPRPFTKGSGRLELAEAIASPQNPLTARVLVNRVWQLHFGQGIVRTPGNFGQLGERPTHPELLDYLAARLVENRWSIKALHREIMLSATYALSSRKSEENARRDAGNRLLWRANLVERLDVEALRDAMLAVAGNLDRNVGGAPEPVSDRSRRRTVYLTVARTKPDRTMALFDFPDPNATSEQRLVTVGPLQRLFFLNSTFVLRQSKALAARAASEASDDAARIERMYRLLFVRKPTGTESRLGLEFLKDGGTLAQYAQVLLSSSEFSSVN